MADAPPALDAPSQFPPADLPTVFVDGVLNIANSPTLVRFYLARFNPTLDGSSQTQTQPVTQVIMPFDSFVQTTIFFQRALDNFINQGLISQDRVQEIRRITAEG